MRKQVIMYIRFTCQLGSCPLHYLVIIPNMLSVLLVGERRYMYLTLFIYSTGVHDFTSRCTAEEICLVLWGPLRRVRGYVKGRFLYAIYQHCAWEYIWWTSFTPNCKLTPSLCPTLPTTYQLSTKSRYLTHSQTYIKANFWCIEISHANIIVRKSEWDMMWTLYPWATVCRDTVVRYILYHMIYFGDPVSFNEYRLPTAVIWCCNQVIGSDSQICLLASVINTFVLPNTNKNPHGTCFVKYER